MKRRCLFLMTIILISVSACAQSKPPRSCDEISQAALRLMIQKALPAEELPQLVSDTFGVPQAEVFVQPVQQGSDVRWKSDGVQYELLVQAAQATLARVTYESSSPSGDRILQCLGIPDKYWAYYYPMITPTQRLVTLNLFFPAIGSACWIDKYGRGDSPPAFEPSDNIAACDFVPTSPPDQVISRLLSDLAAPRAARWIEEQLKPWPADWQSILVETRPLP